MQGWNGSSFSIPIIDPYTTPLPNASLDTYLPTPVNTRLGGGLNYLSQVGEFVLVGTDFHDNKMGTVKYQTSKDLISWSEPVVLMKLTHMPGIRDGKGECCVCVRMWGYM